MGNGRTRSKHRTPEERIADLEAELQELRQQVRDKRKFSPEAVSAERERLQLSAADYGELVGVSALTIYGWEHGRSEPRQEQLEKWLSVRGIPETKAWDQLGLEPPGNDLFDPDAVYAERERLELSAKDYGELVGVSGLTIYNWEKGKTKPRQAQLEKWLAVKGIGKREAWRRLGLT